MVEGVVFNWVEARTVSRQLEGFARELETLSSRTRQQVQGMAQFAGETRQAFEEQIQGWKTNASRLEENLGSLAHILASLADEYEARDKGAAGALRNAQG
jgi:WXG100 family type VII secretion target